MGLLASAHGVQLSPEAITRCESAATSFASQSTQRQSSPPAGQGHTGRIQDAAALVTQDAEPCNQTPSLINLHLPAWATLRRSGLVIDHGAGFQIAMSTNQTIAQNQHWGH